MCETCGGVIVSFLVPSRGIVALLWRIVFIRYHLEFLPSMVRHLLRSVLGGSDDVNFCVVSDPSNPGSIGISIAPTRQLSAVAFVRTSSSFETSPGTPSKDARVDQSQAKGGHGTLMFHSPEGQSAVLSWREFTICFWNLQFASQRGMCFCRFTPSFYSSFMPARGVH